MIEMEKSFSRQHYFFLASLSFSLLLYELCLTRVLSAYFFHHTAFMSITLAMLGTGIGASWVYIFGQRKTELYIARFLMLSVVGILLLPVFIAFFRIDFSSYQSLWSLDWTFLFLGVTILCFLPFLGMGVVLAWWFTKYPTRANELYAWDMLGAGLGAFCMLPIMNSFGGIQALFMCSCFLSISWLLWMPQKQNARLFSKIAVISSGSCFLVQALFSPLSLQYDSAPNKKKPKALFEKWNAFSRVIVLPHQGWDRGMSQNRRNVWSGKLPKQLDALIDIHAFAPILRFDGNLKKVAFLKEVISNLGYYLIKKEPKVLIFGPGGGKDVVAALAFGAKKVVGVEVNPILVDDLVKKRLKTFTNDLYHHPKVNIHVSDARTFAEASKEKFDIILANSVVTLASQSSGSLNLTEQSLFTKEACNTYVQRLSNKGVLSVSVWDNFQHSLPIRWLMTCREAFLRLGIKEKNYRNHVVVVGNKREKGSYFVNILLSKEPLSRIPLQKLTQRIHKWGYSLFFAPGSEKNVSAFSQFFQSPRDFVKKQQKFANIAAATDDKPFFLYTMPFSKAWKFWEMGFWSENAAIVNVFLCLLIVSLTLCSLLFVPLLRRSRSDALGIQQKVYFLLTGAGFMLIEIPLIQSFSIYLGHPTYSLMVVLAGLLLSCGLGNFLFQRVPQQSLFRVLGFQTIALLGLVVVWTLLFPSFSKMTIAFGLPHKIIFSMGMLFPFGCMLGSFLPTGIRILKTSPNTSDSAISWAWSLNATSSVFASIFCLWLSVQWGFSFCLFLGIGCYFVGFTSLLSKK